MIIANSIEESIIKNIGDDNVVFVFPTEVSCKAWADWAVKNKDTTGVCAVSMERFIAWDTFKGECIRTKQIDKTTVPSLMRKVFATYLIEKNAQIKKDNISNNTNNPLLFKTLITADFADDATSFSDWISGILPSLKMWHNYHESQGYKDSVQKLKAQALADGRKFVLSDNDDEDADFETLYNEYGAFLEENKLFDPAWEQPPFVSDGETEYVIVYPQILEDWSQYKFLLEQDSKQNSHKLSFINVPTPENLDLEALNKKTKSFNFDTSVEELHDVALYLRYLHDEEKIAWTDISINVPNMNTYGSYLERELNLFEIPNVMRYSKMLSDFGAGQLFTQIQECVRSDYSFESVKTLLLNDDIPWKNKYLINRLIMFGKDNNCVCSYNGADGKVDIWEKSFDNPVMSVRDALEKMRTNDESKNESVEELRRFYHALKFTTEKMVHAKSFKGLLKAYRNFRSVFIDRYGFKTMKKSDLVLSRCITELTELSELENQYCKSEKGTPGKRADGLTAYKIKNVYGFFISHIAKVQYLEQTEQRGIQVYPYRAAAALPCKVHIVVDATQDSLSVSSSFKQLSFLNESKRDVILNIDPTTNDKFFKFTDDDPSESFMTLYQLSSQKNSYFTSSVHSMGGYGFPHGFLKTIKKDDAKEKKNHFAIEKLSFIKNDVNFPQKLFLTQKIGFDGWKKFRGEGEFKFDLKMQEKIRNLIDKKFLATGGKFNGKYKISASTLKAFYKCPRQWLFEKVLGLKPLNNEADLMNDFIIGRINHAIFEVYLSMIKKEEKMLGETLETVSGIENIRDEYKKKLKSAIEIATSRFTELKDLHGDDLIGDTLSEMTKTIVLTQKNELYEKILPSVFWFTKFFEEFKVWGLEKEYNFAPEGKNYYLTGRIDCILRKDSSSDDSEDNFCIVDFKTSATPSNLLCDKDIDSDNANFQSLSKIPDFQMPMYKKLFSENPVVVKPDGTEVKIVPKEYFFYSIKKMEKKPVGVKGKTLPLTPETMEATCNVCDKLIDEFYEKVFDKGTENEPKRLDFDINLSIQKKSVCASKDEYGNGCKDYQAICRRFFTVAGRE